MTCMPASRRARATTLMPRSWPSRPTLARTMRTGGAFTITALSLLEEPAHPDEEIPEHLGQNQVLVRGERLSRLVRGIDVRRLGPRIEHAHDHHPGALVFDDLRQHLPPAVARREHLEDEFGRDRQVALWERPFRDPRITVESHVGTPYRVGVSFRDYPGVIANDVAEVTFIHEVTYDAV